MKMQRIIKYDHVGMSVKVLMLFLAMVPVSLAAEQVAKNEQLEAASPDGIMCVYPISGQYGLLPRLLYYALLILSAAMQKRSWLVGGALASVMTFSSTAAIHALVLTFTLTHKQCDLDTFGIWALLSAGILAVEPVMETSNSLRESQYRPIIGFWVSLLAVGGIISVIAMFRTYPTEIECLDASSDPIETSAQILSGANICTYQCMYTHQILRQSTSLQVIPAERITKSRHASILMSAMITICSSLCMVLVGSNIIPRKRTEAELYSTIAKASREPRGESTKKRRHRQETLRSAEMELSSGVVLKTPSFLAIVNPILFVIVVVLNEYFILYNPQLPSLEMPYEVSQWSPFVTVGLVLIAAAINKYYEPKWEERQKTLAAEREAFELRQRNPSQVQAPQDAQTAATGDRTTLEEPSSSSTNLNGTERQQTPIVGSEVSLEAVNDAVSDDNIQGVQRRTTPQLEEGIS